MKKKAITPKKPLVAKPAYQENRKPNIKIENIFMDEDKMPDLDKLVRTMTQKKAVEAPKIFCHHCTVEVTPYDHGSCVQVSNRSHSNTFLCNKCVNDTTVATRCEACGNFHLVANLTEGYCRSCVDNAHKTVMRSYHTKVEQVYAPRISINKSKFVNKEFSAEKYGNLSIDLLGIELEYETKNNYGLSIIKYSKLTRGMAIVKRDSSLIRGFEVVSLPADKQSHYEMWKPFFDSMGKDENIFCADFDPVTEKGCGCHIHISKDMFMQGGQNNQAGLAVAKLITFIHAPENRNFIEIIAGRKSNLFCNFHTQKGIQFKNGRPTNTVGMEDAFYVLNHRTAVNTHTSNGKTVEFRFFRSTKNIEELYKNIDFVCALCNFCKPSVASVSQMNDWIYFHEFVLKNRQDYPYLFRFFMESPEFLALVKKQEAKFNFSK